MDPITTAIVAAISARAQETLTDTNKQTITDSYNKLKFLIQQKFGRELKIVKAIDDLEEDQDSKGQLLVLEERIAKARADQEPDLLQAAETLLEQIGGEQKNKAATIHEQAIRINHPIFTTLAIDTSQKEGKNLSQIRIAEESLPARSLINIVETFIELHTKLWLIKQDRLDDFLEYTNTKPNHFEEDTNLIIEKLSYNSPLKIIFDVKAKDIAEAIRTIVDTFLQAKHRSKALELENSKNDLENQKIEMKLNQQKIEIGLELACKVFDKLHPNADEEIRATYIEGLLPTFAKMEDLNIIGNRLSKEDKKALSNTKELKKI